MAGNRPPCEDTNSKYVFPMNDISFYLQPFDNSATAALSVAISGNLRLQNNKINISYRIVGDIDKIQLPGISVHPSRKDQLWNSTCCELFLGASNKPAYWEYNFSPSHDWALFSFTDYRKNKTDDPSIAAIDITTNIDNGREFTLNTLLTIPDALLGHDLDVGVSSIVKDHAGNIHYYALSHPGDKPDFHQRNCFTIHVNAKQAN